MGMMTALSSHRKMARGSWSRTCVSRTLFFFIRKAVRALPDAAPRGRVTWFIRQAQEARLRGMLAPTVERLSDRDASRPTRARSATQSSFDADLARAVREVRLLAAVTPCNLAEERARLLRGLGRGNASNPRYGYVPASRSELRLTLAGLWESSATAVPDRLLGVYRARIEELDLEARIAESAGTLRLGDLAASRFAEEAPAAPGKPFAGVTEWLKLPAPAERGGVQSDALDPTSLLSSMRRAGGEARLPFRVEVSATLSSRAATGERTLWVAKGRL